MWCPCLLPLAVINAMTTSKLGEQDFILMLTIHHEGKSVQELKAEARKEYCLVAFVLVAHSTLF